MYKEIKSVLKIHWWEQIQIVTSKEQTQKDHKMNSNGNNYILWIIIIKKAISIVNLKLVP